MGWLLSIEVVELNHHLYHSSPVARRCHQLAPQAFRPGRHAAHAHTPSGVANALQVKALAVAFDYYPQQGRYRLFTQCTNIVRPAERADPGPRSVEPPLQATRLH